MLGVVARDRRPVGRTAIKGDGREDSAMTANSFRQKLLGRWLIVVRDEQKVNRFAVLVHSTIQILPRAFHFERRLTQTGRLPRSKASASSGLYSITQRWKLR